jgi:CheY-like chemotaxis protein
MRSGEHLLGLINDVLSISKIEAGKQTLNTQVFGLGRLLKGLEEIFTPRTRAKGLYLKFEQAPELPQFVLGDEGKLRQVLINLLGNAVKFTKAGGITLRARWREGIGGFDIEDTGPGISEAEQKAIFEPFAQSRSGVDSKQGTGLGLTISRNFVQLMGGDLCVKSIEGQGSTFSFEINLSASNEIEEGSEERKVIGLEPGQPSYRILVADDRWENRALLVKLLAAAGFVIREAVDGNEVLETWRTWQPHLIWMDVRMPGMDGLEATRTIRSAEADQGLTQLNDAPPGREVGQLPKSEDWARCVIIALTASAFEHHRVAILAAGCDDFVTKPFRTATVFEKLVKHLGVRFVYDEPEIASSARQAEFGAAMGRLASLPEQWIEELAQAAAIGDDQAAHRIVDQITEKDDGLGRELRRMVKRFEFEQIARSIGEALK